MYAFEYERPSATAEAARLAEAGGTLLAGGQTLLASMKLRLAQPDKLIDLGAISELSGIRREGDAMVIGAMTRHADVASNAEVQSAIPALAELASLVGDRQVRAMGTLGGSLANNDPAADYPAGVLGLGATVITNKREIAADDFFEGLFATALEEGEIITAVRFPIPKRAAYVKFAQPASRFALIGVFVAETAGGMRVAVTGGGHGVFRQSEMEAALASNFSADAVKGIQTDESELSGGLHGSTAYRAHLISVIAARAVTKAAG